MTSEPHAVVGDKADGLAETKPLPTPWRARLQDLEFGRVLGEGTFSTVFLATESRSRADVAVKVCNKCRLVSEGMAMYVRREKEALLTLSAAHAPSAPFFVQLLATFQDAGHLYFVLSYAENGDLLKYIEKLGSLDIACIQFYGAEIVRSLEHLYTLGIVHRDLKPGNILLDESMHIKITDFGSTKILHKNQRTPPDIAEELVAQGMEEQDEMEEEEEEEEGQGPSRGRERRRCTSFVGTAQYIAPEVLRGRRVSPATDLWALGCCLYEMAVGSPPFLDEGEYGTFKKIVTQAYSFPREFDSCAKDLIEKLLMVNPVRRLGALDTEPYTSLREHALFAALELDVLHASRPPTLAPGFFTHHDGRTRSEEGTLLSMSTPSESG